MALVAAVLVAGVLRFEWDPQLLLFVYWVEAGIAAGRGVLQSLFAELPPSEAYRPCGTRMPFPLAALADVRGGVRLASWLPPVYPRNVPYVVLAVIPIAAFWPLAGLLLTGAVAPVVTT
ncbi:multidrug ABC transporter ATPase, partial [Halorubrum sp. SS7]